MRKDIYEVIKKNLKLNEEQIYKLFEENNYLNQIIPADILQIIQFFEQFGISKEEMAEISLKNPYILTESLERIRYIEKYFKLINIEDLRWMAVHHPISMSQDPYDIKSFIEENESQGKTKEEIRKMLMDDFEKYFTL